jgi:TetR/AcrR family transcriptional repressor of nem operon
MWSLESFRDLATDVGIKSDSIHYFPSKGDLGGELAMRHTADFEEYLEGGLASTTDAATCISKYTDLFRTTLLNENRMCLGGIMAAEHKELPDQVSDEVVKFGEMNVRWLTKILLAGNEKSSSIGMIQNRALAIFSAIQGAQRVAGSRGDVNAYDATVEAYRASGLIP